MFYKILSRSSLYLFTFITIFCLFCRETDTISPEQKVKDFFSLWAKKDTTGINNYLTNWHKTPNNTWEFNKLALVIVLYVKDCTTPKNKEIYLKYGRGRITHPHDLKIFCVGLYFLCKKGQICSVNNEIYNWTVTIIKETKSSEWLIDDWGY